MSYVDFNYYFEESEKSSHTMFVNFVAFCFYNPRKATDEECPSFLQERMVAHCVAESSSDTKKCEKIVNRGVAKYCHYVGPEKFCGRNNGNYKEFLPQSTTTTTSSTTMKPVITTTSSFPASAFFGGLVGGFIFGLLFMTIFLCLCKRKPETHEGLDAETGKRKKKSKTKTSSGTNTTETTGTGTTNTGKTKKKKKDKKKKGKKVKKSKKSKNTTETNTATAY
ncbi:unnamed protein product [Caenorhabditis nigoni]